MTVLSLTNPTPGTTADANVIASNNNAILAVINGNIDNANLSPTAAIAISKLAGYPTDATKFLNGGGTWTAVAATSYRKVTAKTVNTTTAATDLLNGEITIAANALGATGLLRLTAWGDNLNNSGGTVAFPRFQATLGGTTLLDSPAIVQSAATATRYGWKVVLEVLNLTSGTQVACMVLSINGNIAATASSVFITGAGQLVFPLSGGAAAGFGQASNSGLTIDTTGAKALVLNVINGSASASYETKLFGAVAEVI